MIKKRTAFAKGSQVQILSIRNDILARRDQEGWEAGVVERLSADLQREFPGQSGLSPLVAD